MWKRGKGNEKTSIQNFLSFEKMIIILNNKCNVKRINFFYLKWNKLILCVCVCVCVFLH